MCRFILEPNFSKKWCYFTKCSNFENLLSGDTCGHFLIKKCHYRVLWCRLILETNYRLKRCYFQNAKILLSSDTCGHFENFVREFSSSLIWIKFWTLRRFQYRENLFLSPYRRKCSISPNFKNCSLCNGHIHLYVQFVLKFH